MDIFQVLANAFAGAFGMGVANEMYHAFREYRKVLKQRLLDDTVKAINIYRKIKAEERFRNVVRTAHIPRKPVPRISTLIVIEDDLPKRTPVIGKPEPVEPEPTKPWRKVSKREAQLTYYEPPDKLNYTLPERSPIMESLPSKMIDWEEPD